MKHWIWIIGILLCLGCQPQPSTEHVVAKVGDYIITQEEFDEEYQNSTYASQNSPASRHIFLDHMINQKLILLAAQQQGLDKDKDFLKMVEHFWQQSLTTVALQVKTKEGINLEQWVDYLKKNTKIEINQESLK